MVLCVLLAGCAVEATVTVKVADDGSGTVTLVAVADAGAVREGEAGGGKLEDRVRLSDLPAAGWTVSPWTRRPDGSASVTLTKPFADVDQIASILHEISGPAGPLHDVAFTRNRSFLGTTFAAKAGIDQAGVTTGITTDPELAGRIAAQGLDVGVVDGSLLAELRRAVTVHLVVELPGGERHAVTVAPGRSAVLDASATVWNLPRIGLLALAAAILLLAAAVGFWPRRRRRSERAAPPGRAGRGGRSGRSGSSGRGAGGRGGGSAGSESRRGVVSPGGRGSPPPRPTSPGTRSTS